MDAVLIGLLCLVVGAIAGYVYVNRRFVGLIKAKEAELTEKEKLVTIATVEAQGLRATIESNQQELEKLKRFEAHYLSTEKVLTMVQAENVGLKNQLEDREKHFTETVEATRQELEKAKKFEVHYISTEKVLTLVQSENVGLQNQIDSLNKELIKANEQIVILKERSAALDATNANLERSKAESEKYYDLKLKDYEQKYEKLSAERDDLSQELTALKEQDPIRAAEYERRAQTLNQAMHNLEKEREKDKQEKAQAEEMRLQKLRDKWLDHELNVEEKIKLIAQELQITYIEKEKFPLKGKPDNSLIICNEHVIFDAKSPEGDDPSSFPTYIRSEAEKMGKYLNQEGVKKDGFLVVPTSAIHVIRDTSIHLGGCRVHVIPVEALLPLIIHLKKIEDYEFAETMSPESRDKIVTYVGRVAHLLKRRAQVDYFFINETISALMAGETLPDDILEAAQKVEKASKLNPPVERRTKKADTAATIKKEAEKLHGRLEGQEIHVGPDVKEGIAIIPLHKINPN